MVYKQKKNIEALILELDSLIEQAKLLETQYEEQLSKVHPAFAVSARNLIHYRALRMADIREFQKKLGNLGLSRVAKAERHLMASLRTNRYLLEGLLGKKPTTSLRTGLTFKKSKRLHRSNAKALLGYRSKNRRTRIMVTLPSEAADNYQLVHDMIAEGMNCARINCAHDDEEVWGKMVEHVRTASAKLKRKCKIAMDLGGPKIRTGALKPGPKVRKFRPDKDVRGRVVHPCTVWLGMEAHPDNSFLHLPLSSELPESLQVGDTLWFKDARGKKRKLSIIQIDEGKGCLANCYKTTYVESGMTIYTADGDESNPIVVGDIPPVEAPILLHAGDMLLFHKRSELGEPAQYDDKSKLIRPAHTSITTPEIFEYAKVGESIFLDDGKIEGKILEVGKEEMVVEVVHVKSGRGKLRAEKGINLPTSDLKISGLTAKDKRDLEFVVQHADVVNLSFVNSAQDVRDLLGELERLNAKNKIGIILKIETQKGFNNLTEILLEAMQVHPVGVMIARGDLAIESGWKNIGRIQEEILSLCLAAHVPDIWATQVLENMAKQGIPSRAEITDAAMAQRADCVMLNKGPYILRAIHLLDVILKSMKPYQDKNIRFSPILEKADVQASV